MEVEQPPIEDISEYVPACSRAHGQNAFFPRNFIRWENNGSARTIIHQPELLQADEPTASLDPRISPMGLYVY